VYFQYMGRSFVGLDLGWLYFGIGSMQPSNEHPVLIAMTTSRYRPPALVARIALDVADRGRYEVMSRRPGLLSRPGVDRTFDMDGASGGRVRYTSVCPSFGLGTTMGA